MPTSDALMGLGLPPDLAAGLGLQVQTVTCKGTSSTTAANILEGAHLVLLNGTASNTGATLPSGAGIGTPYYCFGVGTTAPVIYAPTGQSINSGAASLTLSAAISGGILVKSSSTQWYSVPLAP